MKYLESLNKNQKEAVLHKEGPCLVVAGAGSGKTKVLTTKIAYLIESGIYSGNILAITFTNKAAKEMRYRLAGIVPNNYAFVGTFHSLGVKFIRENYDKMELLKNFTIIDADDVLSIIKKIMKDLAIDIKEISPTYIRTKISFIKNEMLSKNEIEKFFTSYIDKKVIEIYNRYENILSRNNSIDFDDLLKKPVQLLLNNPDILEKYQDKFQYILVDEYQDTNEVQYKLVRMLSQKYQNIFVVGDMNQSIYSFRGANYKNILKFERDFKNTKVITLSQNYRSTTNILSAANDVIKNNPEKKEVELFSELGTGVKIKYNRSFNDRNEINTVCAEITNLLSAGYQKKDIAVFYRTNAQSRLIEEGMMKNNIPYKVVGSFFFYKRKEIKDLLGYLKLISNQNDNVALERIINVPKKGIGETTINNIRNKAQNENISMFEAIDSKKELKFKEVMLDLIAKKEELSLTELIDYVLLKSGILEELEKEKSLEADLRIENLMEFKSITEHYQNETGTVNLEDFLEDISLVADMTEHQEYDDVVTLMTIHSAKGLEFRAVFIIGMEEGIFPHVNASFEKEGIEEERRLCYVAITRAKEKLYISNAERRMLYGKMNLNLPSRFIDEINEALLEKEEEKRLDLTINKNLLYGDNNTEYKNGDLVVHITFGKGIVTAFDERFVTVAFDKRYGIKKVLKNYKGMKKK